MLKQKNMTKNEKYQHYLDNALFALFRSTDDAGFWDENQTRIIKRRIFDENQSSHPDLELEMRYAPFALMGVLYWRYTSSKFNTQYDDKIEKYLYFLSNYFTENKKRLQKIKEFELGLLLCCFAIGYLITKNRSLLQKSLHVINVLSKNFKKIIDNHAAFILFGLTWLYEALRDLDTLQADAIKEMIKFHGEYFCQHQDELGVFQTGDKYAAYHQRMCYPLWALTRSAHILNDKNFYPNIEKTLNFILKYRTLEDFGFKWHEKQSQITLKYLPFKMPVNNAWSTGLLFSCHQAFFTFACEQYRSTSGNHNFYEAGNLALEWIWGNNRKNLNLVEFARLGVPWRTMDLKGNLVIPGQNFIGAYEVGAYIMALSDLLAYC